MRDIITVLGSLNMDLSIESTKPLKMGETIRGNGFVSGPGGKGANQAVALGKLGANAHMIGKVGHDLFGQRLTENLKSNGVNVDQLQISKDAPTGTAVIILHEGNNVIIVDLGANHQVTTETVHDAEDLIKKSAMLIAQLEVPYEAVREAFRLARHFGVKTLLNPSPYREIDTELFRCIDILMANEIEASDMAGVEVRDIPSAKQAAEVLIKRGIPTPVITLGAEGCVYATEGGISHTPARKVQAVDTTSAGDSFLGAFAYSLVKGETVDEAAAFAAAASSITVSRRGAQDSLPSLAEVEALFNR